jgi:flotillin
MIGKVGQAEKEGQAKQEIAKIDARTAVLETDRRVEKANADQKLKTREIIIARELKLEQIAAQRAAEQKDAELQKSVEQKRAEMELERLRATTVTQAKIAKESAQQKADADLYTQEKKADAAKYNQKADSEAVYFNSTQATDAANYKLTREAAALLDARTNEAEAAYILATRQAEATYLARERDAEAAYITRKKESEGLMEMAKAYGALADVLGGPQGLMNYLMLKEGVFVKLAEANAKAINGLAPKINVWTTEGGNSGGADAMAPIQNLFKSLPPLFSTIQDQTGMTPPTWLANVPERREMEPEEKAGRKREAMGLTNGHGNGH